MDKPQDDTEWTPVVTMDTPAERRLTAVLMACLSVMLAGAVAVNLWAAPNTGRPAIPSRVTRDFLPTDSVVFGEANRIRVANVLRCNGDRSADGGDMPPVVRDLEDFGSAASGATFGNPAPIHGSLTGLLILATLEPFRPKPRHWQRFV
jgi:hypothetical protein